MLVVCIPSTSPNKDLLEPNIKKMLWMASMDLSMYLYSTISESFVRDAKVFKNIRMVSQHYVLIGEVLIIL